MQKKIIAKVFSALQGIRIIRIMQARLYPYLKKSGLLGWLRKINGSSLSDPFNLEDSAQENLFRVYDLENFNVDEAMVKYTLDPLSLCSEAMNYRFGIICDLSYGISDFISACKALGTTPVVFDIHDHTLTEKLKEEHFDGLFIYPYSNSVGVSSIMELLLLITSETSVPVYPTLRELSLYESKRAVAAFLSLNDIAHPRTRVFYDPESAGRFLETCCYPVVFKTNGGASASGVEILKDRKSAVKLAGILFKKYYLKKKETDYRNMEWGYMLLQDYIEDVKEYRIIKVGDSWFGYQKWKKPGQEFLSGSGIQKMSAPALKVFDYCRALAEKHQFTTMCFDIFENMNGDYLVNELQTWFGSYDPSEMYVDNIPGRYLFSGDDWIFEPGFFNVHGSNLLRIAHFISILKVVENKHL